MSLKPCLIAPLSDIKTKIVSSSTPANFNSCLIIKDVCSEKLNALIELTVYDLWKNLL